MTEIKSKKAISNLAQDTLSHNRDLLLALSRAAQSIQRAHTVDEICRAVGTQIKSLGGEVALLMLDEERKSLTAAYMSYAPSLLRRIEKLTGSPALGYRIALTPDSVYARDISATKAEYVHSAKEHFYDAFPKALHPLVVPVMNILKIQQGILAPLYVEGETLGLLMVSGLALNEGDVPAMESFAGQIAAGLQNARLLQMLQDELYARRQAEESLNHNRNLLLALGKAAQAVQLAREPEEIYRVVGEQIQALGFEATILTFGSDQSHLYYRYTTLPKKIIRAAEKLAGLSAQEYNWPVPPDSIYGRIIKEGKAEYIPWAGELFSQALPTFLQPLSRRLMTSFQINQGVLAPLHVGNDSFGILAVFGSELLSEADLPAIDSFAGQVSISLRNAWLVQQVENELKERNQAEAALRASEAKIHALMDAVPDMMFMLNHEGVFLDYHASKKELLYAPPETFLGRNIRDVLPSQMVDMYVFCIEQIAKVGESQLFEYTLEVAGEQHFFEAHVVAYQGDHILCVVRNITRRKKAEEAVRQTEKHFKALIEKAADGIALIGPDGKTKYASPSARRMFKYGEVEDINDNPLEFVHPDDTEIVLRAMNDLIQDPACAPTIEYRYKHHDNTYHWVESTFSNLLTEPSVQAVVVNFRDINERKNIEKVLAENERYYRALIENAADGILVVNTDGTIRYESPSVARMLGYAPHALVGTSAFDLINPDDLGQIMNAFMNGLTVSGFIHRGEYRLRNFLGEWRYFEIVSHYLLEDPVIDGVIINGRDITERKQAETELLESRLRYQRLTDHAPDIIFRYIIQPSMELVYINPAVQTITGYTPEDCYADPQLMLNMIHPEDLHLMMSYIQSLTPPSDPMVMRWVGKDGVVRWMESRIVPIVNENRQLTAVEGITRDITRRTLAEEALRDSERKFHSVISKSADGIALSDEEGRVIEFNDAFERIIGRKREMVLGQFLWDLGFNVTSDALKKNEYYLQAKREIQRVLETGESQYLYKIMDVPFKHSDGTIRHIQQRLFTIPTEKGWRLGSVSRDVTELKQAEEKLHQQYANLHSLYQMTATISQSVAIEGVYSAALDSLQSTLFADRVSILLFDEHGVMRFKAWRNLSDAYRQAAEGHSPWKQDALNPQPVLVPDALKDSSLASLQALFVEEGIGALGFIPLVHQGRLLGKFMIYFNTPHQFTTEEVQLAETIARHVAFAIFRRQAEKALQASEERYRILYEDNPSMYFTADVSGTVLSVNKFVIEQLGYSVDELAGQSILNVFHSDDREAVQQHFQVCLQHLGQAVQMEVRKVRKNGTVLWVRESACAVHDLNGQVVVLLICDDITERREAQEARTASLAELHALFASMRDAVLVIDQNGYYRKVAPTNPDKLYIQPEDVVGKHLSDFFPAGQVEKFCKVIKQVLETQQTLQIEYKLEVNGSAPWFEASISPMDSDTTLWVARDISERKQVEAQIHLQSAALEAVANTIIITDRDGIIQWANSSFHNLTGFDTSEAVGKNPRELIYSGKQSREFYKDMWNTILSGNIWHNELVNRRKDGSLYFEEMTITPLHNLDGEISHFIAVKQDISDRKHAEEALIQSEKAYRTLFENVPIGLYRTSVDGHILDANPALIKMLGSPDLHSLMQKKAWDYYADTTSNEKFMEEISEHGVLSAFEAEYRRLDQTTFWAEDYVNIIRDDSGTPLYFEGSLVDINDRKKSENELREMNQSLQLAHSELQQMFEHEQVLSRTDSLTGQTNRRYFFELAIREFNAGIRYQRPLTIILFDIDGFKQVNDTFGHALGDKILVQVAHATAAQVRDVDVLARYGGDEFIILLPQTSEQKAFLIAERIRESVAAMGMDVENSPFIVTLSMGVAEIIYKPQDESIEDVIRRADQALYQAKKNGRNHTVIYTEL
ncbi:MAG: PAS domain S-box protein [Anaerolineales bacterium]